MISESVTGNSQRRFNKRLLFNGGWLVVLLGAATVYTFSSVAMFKGVNPWYERFLLAYGPFIVGQAVFHWLTLNRFFPEMKRGNLYWVLAMPVLFIISFALVMLAVLMLTADKLG